MKSLFSILLLLLLYSCGYVQDAKETTWEQTRPKMLLKKYEYFKDLSATLQQQKANLEMYKEELSDSTLTGEYRQQRKSEALGIAANYNGLAAEYNAAMSKINYEFCNVGTLPASNLTPLPREFAPYIFSLKTNQ